MRHLVSLWRYCGVALGIMLLTVVMGALAARHETYLLFHLLIELASVVVGVAIFSIGWSTRRIASNSFLLVFAIGALFVGAVDLLHALAYKGMSVFPWDNNNLPTQFWVAARYLESLSFLIGAIALLCRRAIAGERLLLLYLVLTSALILAIIPLGIFPTAFRVPGGLTPFKLYSEYGVVGVFLVAGVLIWTRRVLLDAYVASLLLLTIGLKVVSEIAFTLYGVDVYGVYNALGHLCKGYATIALYSALVHASVTMPYQTLFRDLHQSQEALWLNREWLRVTLQSMGDAVIATDITGHVTFLNPVATALTGLAEEDALGQPIQAIFRIVDEQTGMPRDDVVAWVLRKGRHVELANHTALVTRSNQIIPIEDSAAPIRDAAGSVSGVVLVFHDVTEKRRAQDALQKREEHLRLLIENAPASLAMFDRQMCYLSASKRWLSDYKLGDRDLRGLRYYEIFPDAPESLRAIHARALGGEVVRADEDLFIRADGTEQWLKWEVQPWRDATGAIAGVVIFSEDITKRKHAEEARDRALAELDSIFTTLADPVIVLRADGMIIRMNPATERILGYSPNVCTLPLDPRLTAVEMAYPDGLKVPQDETPIMRALQGEIVQGVVMKCYHHDSLVGWFANSAVPIRTADGQVAGVVATFTDVTAMHALQEQQQTLLHLVSHDLRAPLTIIKGYASLLENAKEQPNPEQLVQTAITAMLRSINRMDAMIDDLVEVTRLEGGRLQLQRQPVQLSEYLDDLVVRAGKALELSRLQLDIPAILPPILVDPNRLERILLNLISNALKYSDCDSPVTLHAYQQEQECMIAVHDRGNGIPPNEMTHLFERFYRAAGSRKAEGIGLGLYITRLLVEAHGGHIWVESEVGKGSTFIFSLPSAWRASTKNRETVKENEMRNIDLR